MTSCKPGQPYDPGMLTPAGLIGRAVERLRAQDPELDALRRAARAAVTVPVAAAVARTVAPGTEVPLYALLGAFWLMVVVDFPGNRQNRAVGYLGLGLNGVILLALGTLVAPIPWLATTLMFVIGVAVTLAGVVSETVSAGQRATLLLYVWPVCTPVGAIGERLLGWSIALAICVPAALFLIPPRHHGELRRHVAQVCGALADRLDGVGSPAELTSVMGALRSNFLAASFRPVGLSAGSRALVRVVDQLEVVTEVVDADTAAALGPMKQPAINVLRCCARVLDVSRLPHRAADRAELKRALDELRTVARGRYREDLTEILGERDDDAAVSVGRELLSRRTIATTIRLIGSIIGDAATADARPVWARALGLRLPATGSADRLMPETVALATIPSGFLATRSVAARNSVRTGVGLAVAVAVTHLFPVQHGFWVVLGAMVVLGSSALSTRTKVLQAMVGTAVGVSAGALLTVAFGVDAAVLWSLLPVGVFGSAYFPRLSFTAGQAVSAMTVLIILNLNAPTGWQIGLLRIEDVAIGAGVGIVVSLLLWPRGATAAVSAMISTALDLYSRYLQAAVLRVTRGISDETVEKLSLNAVVVSRTVDDAVRHYLSETGSGADLRTPVVRAASRATRLRVAADVIADIRILPPPSAYPRARTILEEHAESVSQRFAGESDKAWLPISDEVVRALRAEGTQDDAAISAGLPLVAVAANIGALELMYPAPTTSDIH
jgi:Fusaric acid resistance protein-like